MEVLETTFKFYHTYVFLRIILFLFLSKFFEEKKTILIFPFLEVMLSEMTININFLYFWLNQCQQIACKTFVLLNLVSCFISSSPKFLDLELRNVTKWTKKFFVARNVTKWTKKFFVATINSSSHKQVW